MADPYRRRSRHLYRYTVEASKKTVDITPIAHRKDAYD